MGRIIIHEETSRKPITMIGSCAGLCWGADTSDEAKNYKRGLECIKANHGRTLEFPDVYFTADGYSARVIREFYTHIGGAPTRLQASTRYIDYKNFEYVTPASIADNDAAKHVYDRCMRVIRASVERLESAGIPREDSALLLPLGMTTRMIDKCNLRHLIDMSHQRMCSRANHEFRELFTDLTTALCEYSDQWAYLVQTQMMPKCDYLGYCPETHGCGKRPHVKTVYIKETR